ncbi:carbohydrate ABC transporter permease [Butyrivibrio sp. MC2013]|uniref:carbohydrate ABC transporter permease n=1 Tax=Butyrivibrio sp. MC2013 TaxID=1280686 RepID=UPI00041FD6B8|nr:carbohydrate ABC transporter permease [Butyrivibrio sp. MC2013]
MAKEQKSKIGRYKPSNILFNLINYSFLTILTLVCFYPILHVILASISDPSLLIKHQGILLKPLGEASLNGYRLVFKDSSILVGFKNTLVYVGLGTAVNMIFTICGAYALSRRDLLFKGPVMLMITVTMFFGGGLIPWFLIMKNIGMYNNLAAMILPTALNTWNMIILRTGFQGLPYELEEAAIIDGAGQAQTLLKVILPLSKPVLAVIFLYYLVGNWNSWFNAMVLLADRELYPLQLLLKEILVMNDTSMSSVGSAGGVSINSVQGATAYRELVKYCVTVIATLPILCVYPFLQKYFVKGVYVGSIKG